MGLIDSHAHLDRSEYGDDLPGVVARARAAGLAHVVLIGQWRDPSEAAGQAPDLATGAAPAPVASAAARAALELARTDPLFFSATAGLHPHDSARATASDLDELAQLCAEPDLVAVGECGLDYHYDRSPRDVQRERFAWQIGLARELDKPLVVHTREAHEDTAALLERGLGPRGGIIHCFTGNWTEAQRYLALGLSISLSGVVTFRSAAALREAACRIPLERLLIETDCPFLAPVPHRGKRNEPAFLRHTAACLAELRGQSVQEIEAATAANARRALGLRLEMGKSI